jgi:hypothetical protein
LGILINDKLKWRDQVIQVKSRAMASLGQLKRTFTYWDIDGFRTLFTTYVRPHLEYCSAAWSPYFEEDIRMLEAVQRRATKLVPHLKPLKYNERLNAIGIPTLEQRRRRGDLIQNFKIYHGFNKVNFIRPNRSAPAISE